MCSKKSLVRDKFISEIELERIALEDAEHAGLAHFSTLLVSESGEMTQVVSPLCGGRTTAFRGPVAVNWRGHDVPPCWTFSIRGSLVRSPGA